MKESIRQEIYKLMLRARSYDEIEDPNSEYFTNEIIKAFEKRIDKELAHPEDRCNCSYHDGVIFTLNWVKEMLK